MHITDGERLGIRMETHGQHLNQWKRVHLQPEIQHECTQWAAATFQEPCPTPRSRVQWK